MLFKDFVRQHRDAQETREDIETRSYSVRAASIDEKNRSVEGILATETPTVVMDRQRWEPILEVLLMSGCQLTDQIPLLADHNRFSIDNVLGSVRELRVKGDELLCRNFFAADDQAADRAWNKVRQGHLRDLSAGYAVNEGIEIPAGGTAEVQGRKYSAPQNMRMRIATKWTPKEGSIVPIGADKRTKTRSEQPLFKEIVMNPKLRKYLETLGLRADATEDQAKAFYQSLPEATRGVADVEGAKPDAPAAPVAPPVPQQRSEAPNPAPVAPPATPATPPLTDAQRAEVELAERKRIAEINRVGEGLPDAMIRQAIDEGWTAQRYAPAFLDAIRGRAPSVGGDGQRSHEFNPAIHSRSHEQDCTAQSLGLGLALRGVSGDAIFKQRAAYLPAFAGSNDYVLRRAVDPEAFGKQMARALEQADQFRSMSLFDVCREACRMDGKPIGIHVSPAEAFRAAVSGSSLSAIFTTNINAMFLVGYMDADDTTTGWCSETDVGNFLTNERATMGKFGSLTKAKKGSPADHLDTSDSKESYKIGRYTGQYVVDEQDIINDRFGAIDQNSPQDMGLSARQLRPNLVYGLLLANAALDADAVALFHATHANLGTGGGSVLAAAGVQAAIQAMAKQRIKTRTLNIKPRFLIVPQDLVFTAEILITSAQRIISSSDGGTYNPLANKGLEIRADDRIGTAGCYDPAAETARTGTATNWFLAARPGEEGAKTIEVGYLRGTGRAPKLRSFVLDKGQWGLGWDIAFDIGGKALDFRGLYKSNGA